MRLRAVLAIASTLAVLLAGEVLFRSIEPPAPGGARVVQWRQYVPDPDLGWAPRVGGSHVLRIGDAEVREVTNARRVLGADVSAAKPAGASRILVLGDSIAEGLEVPAADRVSAQLERLLRAEGRSVEVLNGARTGYQTDQELLYYERDGRSLGADVVVLVAYLGNDVVGNATSETQFGTATLPKPRFRLAGGTLALEPIRGGAGPPERVIAEPAGIDALKAWLDERSALYRAARTAWARVLLLTSTRQVPAYWEILRASPAPQVEEGWALTGALLARLRADVERNGARFVVAVVPEERQVSSAKWQAFLDFYRLDPHDWDADASAQRFAAICADAHLDCVDLLAPLRAAPADPFLPKGGHLDAAGHTILARAVAERLRLHVGERP